MPFKASDDQTKWQELYLEKHAHFDSLSRVGVLLIPSVLIVVFPLKEFHGQPEASNTGDCLSAQWQHPGAIIAALPACTGCNPYLHRVPGHSRR